MNGSVLRLHVGGPNLRKERASELMLKAGFGAVGDRHAGRAPDRALLLSSAINYRLFVEQGVSIDYGDLGENVVVEGLELESFSLATRLRLGTATVEITGLCAVCSNLSGIDLRLPKLAYGKRGVYAAVIDGGVVREGDAMSVHNRTTTIDAP